MALLSTLALLGCGAEAVEGAGACGSLGTAAVLAHASVRQLVLEGDDLYWTSAGGVHRMSKAGGPVLDIATDRSAFALVVDGTHVYWSEQAADESWSIWRASTGGGLPELLQDGIAEVRTLVVHEDELYWVDYVYGYPSGVKGSVHVASKRGGASATLTTLEAGSETSQMQAHASGLYFVNGYCTDPSCLRRIDHVSFEGAVHEPIARSSWVMLLARAGDTLAWTQIDASFGSLEERGSIVLTFLTRGEQRVLFTPSDHPAGDAEYGRIWALAVDARRIYWSFESQRIGMRCLASDDDSAPVFTTHSGSVRQMVADGDTLFYAITNEEQASDRIVAVTLGG